MIDRHRDGIRWALGPGHCTVRWASSMGRSLLFYSRSFEGLSSTLLCKTQYEAAGLGFFLKDLLENVK